MDRVYQTVHLFVEKEFGRPLFKEGEHLRLYPVPLNFPKPDEFIRYNPDVQLDYLKLSPMSCFASLVSTSLSPMYTTAIRDEILDSLLTIVQSYFDECLCNTQNFSAVCSLCSSPSDSSRWRALKLLILLISKTLKTPIPSGLSIDPTILMPRLLDNAFDMNEWLSVLNQVGLGIDTEIIGLKPKWIHALNNACIASETVYFKQLAKTSGESADSGINWLEFALESNPSNLITDEIRESLSELSNAIDIGISKIRERNIGNDPNERNCAVFCKLTTRSPKDSLALRTRKTLKVNCGSEAIELLGCSKRVCEDTEAAFKSNLPLSIAIRKWVKIIDWSECRSFICWRKMTAISQYFAARQLPKLLENKESLITRIQKAFNENLCDSLPYSCSVIDWGLIDDGSEKGKLIALELNPFARTTGACLFHWADDSESLINGPFQSRFNE